MYLIVANIVKPIVLNILDIQGYKTTEECEKLHIIEIFNNVVPAA
jgi:hypothetical protein